MSELADTAALTEAETVFTLTLSLVAEAEIAPVPPDTFTSRLRVSSGP
jgi:hypothetical protein